MSQAATPLPSGKREDLFVGQAKELERIRSELAAGHNLVLTGPFGIGRSALYPAPMVALGPLSAGMAERFFIAWAAHHGLDWGPDIIHGLVLATRGYPTGMWEAARNATATGFIPSCESPRSASPASQKP